MDNDDINSYLNDFGKTLESNDVLEKMEFLRKTYKFSVTTIVNMVLNYLNNEKIKHDIIKLEHIDSFEKEKLLNFSIKEKKSPKIKESAREINFKTLISNDSGFLNQYLEDVELSIINESITDNEPHTDSNFQKVEWDVVFINNQNYVNNIMFQKNREISYVIDKKGVEVLKNQLKNSSQEIIDFSSLNSAGNFNQEEVYVCGRIAFDHSQIGFDSVQFTNMILDDEYEGMEKIIDHVEKLNINNIAIQSYKEFGLSLTPLNLDHVDSYSFFPGQNVILKGKNPSKSEFIVSSIEKPIINPPLSIDSDQVLGALRVIIAAGPFSNFDSILNELKTNLVDVLILIGPIIDFNDTETQSSNDSYSDMHWKKLNIITTWCNQMCTHLIFVPSVDDAEKIPVFPQPASNCPSNILEVYGSFKSPLFHLASNPTVFKVGSYIFGVTSVDVLHNMCSQEINKNCSTTRVMRMCHHLLTENSFYPLKPSHPELNIDWVQWYHHCGMGDMTPNVLILPSKLKTFYEKIDNQILCINPGFMKKPNQKSTYCKLTIPKDFNKNGSVDCKIINI